jgi:BASS family bile acid:Na+ symporter
VDIKTLVLLAAKVSILSTVFSFGLHTTGHEILYLTRRPGLLARSLLSMLVVVPLIALALDLTFILRHTLEVALMALAISPVPPLLPNRESKSGGNEGYALGLMALLGLLAIVTVPLSTNILQRVFNRPLAVPPAAIAKAVFVAILLPLGAGMLVRALFPALASRLEKPVSLIGKVLLLLAALVALAGSWRAVAAALGDGTLIALVAFVALALIAGHVLGGPDPDHSVVLALSSACRHPAIALSIATLNFADEHFAGTILLYLIVNFIVGGVYVAWQRRRAPAVAT